MSERSVSAALLVVAMVAMPSSGAAQASTGELRDVPGRHRIAGELGLFYGDTEDWWMVGLQPAVHAQLGLLEQDGSVPVSVQLDLDWRGSGFEGDGPSGSQSAFRVWNPYLGARVGHGEGEPGSRWRARGGLGITLPLANAYDPGADLFSSLFMGQALTGAWDPWLSSLANMAVVVRGDFEYRHTYFFVGAETALGLLLPIEHQGVTGSTVVVPQVGIWAAGRPMDAIALGLRFQAVASIATNAPSGSSGVEGYAALAPFVRTDIDAGFLETRLVINLDEPFGFAFDDDGYWGWYVGGGLEF